MIIVVMIIFNKSTPSLKFNDGVLLLNIIMTTVLNDIPYFYANFSGKAFERYAFFFNDTPI